MPPQLASKSAVRTHEENQERAYIAASRRSDRSLEARMESARRASEIHKKRTGRALRVTEQDVVNEEMYEEEDLMEAQSPYRHYLAHLRTGSKDFDDRLATYLANQVAVRKALDDALSRQNLSMKQLQENPNLLSHQRQQQQAPSSTPLSTALPNNVSQLLMPPEQLARPSFSPLKKEEASTKPYVHDLPSYPDFLGGQAAEEFALQSFKQPERDVDDWDSWINDMDLTTAH